MWDMREAKDNLETRFAQTFLKLQPEELRLLFGACHDEIFREKHPKLVGYIHKALLYRENQLNTNCEDAASVQDLFLEQWTPDELANGIVGLERLHVLAENKTKILSWVRAADRLLVTRCIGMFLSKEDEKNAG